MAEKIIKKMLPGMYLLGIIGIIITGLDYYNEIQKEKQRLLVIEKVLAVDEIGDKVNLKLNSKNENQKVIYEVENKEIVDINENGELLSVGEGITTVTVTNEENTKTQTFVVGVGDKAIEEIKSDDKKVEQLIKENEILLPTDNNKKEDVTSSVETIVPQASDKPTVVKVVGIKLNKKEITLKYNESAKIVATISPKNATNKNITWNSSNSKLVTVDNNGNIKVVGNKNAEVIVTATTMDGNYKASITIRVKAITDSIKVTGVNINEGSSSTVYLNSENTPNFKLTATISPQNATNKNITWGSSNTTVATVNNEGNVSIKGIGTAKIIATTNDGNYKATYNLIVKQKVILVITASAGQRMQDHFKEYKSSKGNYYYSNGKSKNPKNTKTGVPGDGSLIYVYQNGSQFKFQYEEGVNKAVQVLDSKCGNFKDYVELSVFFTLTGNSVKSYTCDQIAENANGLYTDIAEKYNIAIQKIKNSGYKNIKGFVISHSPLNTKEAIEVYNRTDISYSHRSEACKSGYRSAWKYWLSNRKMNQILSKSNYNLTFINNYENFVVLNSDGIDVNSIVNGSYKPKPEQLKPKFTWLREYNTEDGLHFDAATAQSYTRQAFETAGM